MNSVEELDVFKLAHELALKIYSVTKKFPREEKNFPERRCIACRRDAPAHHRHFDVSRILETWN